MTKRKDQLLTGVLYAPVPVTSSAEEWRSVVGFEGLYLISDLGGLYSLMREKFLRPGKTNRGYLRTTLCRNNPMEKYVSIHCLVAAAFLGPCPEGKEPNHKNGVKTDNRSDNLEYITHRANVQHAYDTGLRKLIGGIHCSKSNLTEENVRDIQARWQALGKKKRGFQTAVAREYEVTGSCIYAIVHGKTWNPSRYKHKAVAAP